MNTRSLLTASLIGGVATAVLSNVPVINLLNCVLCAGFWLGPLLAVWLYRREAGALTLGQSVQIGTLAGVWGGLFGFALSFLGAAGAESLLQTYARFAPQDAGAVAIPAGMGVLFNVVGVGVTILFGAIGGLIGGALFKEPPKSPKAAA